MIEICPYAPSATCKWGDACADCDKYVKPTVKLTVVDQDKPIKVADDYGHILHAMATGDLASVNIVDDSGHVKRGVIRGQTILAAEEI